MGRRVTITLDLEDDDEESYFIREEMAPWKGRHLRMTSWVYIDPKNPGWCEVIAGDIVSVTVKEEFQKSFVYLIGPRDGGIIEVKIGHSKNPEARLKSIRTSRPDCELLWFFQSYDAKGLEKFLHRRFENKQLYGEWFQVEPGDVLSIEKMCQVYEIDVKRRRGLELGILESAILNGGLPID